jgi:uncharacterized protein YbjT (DUF2867 family)
VDVRIAVVGGTGVVGRHVVQAAAEAGHEPVVLARSTGVDLMTGRGLDGALAGAEAVIDASNVQTLSRRRSERFFRAATERLLVAGAGAGVRHHVALSIVGIDRVDFGYYQGKRVQEELVLAGPVSRPSSSGWPSSPGPAGRASPGRGSERPAQRPIFSR